jgi:hypothetical protein
VGLLEASGLLTLVFEPSSDILVDKLARVQCKVTILDHHVSQAIVEINDLGDLSRIKQLGKMFDFSPNRKVVIRNSMRFPLQILSFHSNTTNGLSNWQ